jgi:hypothetical protein
MQAILNKSDQLRFRVLAVEPNRRVMRLSQRDHTFL